MHRTTILIPHSLKLEVEKEAERERVTFGEVVRRSLNKYVMGRKGALSRDSLLSSQTRFMDNGSTDMAKRHDAYLYGDPHQ